MLEAMAEDLPATPQILTMGVRNSDRGEAWTWHTHEFDELCLIAEDSSHIGHGGLKQPCPPNTLYLFRRNEPHGFWNSPAESPDLWIIHFRVADAFFASLPGLADANPKSRVWRLRPAELQEFRTLFVNMHLEAARSTADGAYMCSAWLQLMIGAINRWKDAPESRQVGAVSADPDVLQLWMIVNDAARSPFGDMDTLPDMVEGYDSVRHRFRQAFGMSPRAMMSKLRIHSAQQLLLEGRKSIKEIARAVGYGRQHEFARAFRREVGLSPTEWRSRPRLQVDVSNASWDELSKAAKPPSGFATDAGSREA